MPLIVFLRECSDPTDEDVVRGILQAILVRPNVSQSAEKEKYWDLLIDQGYDTVPALAQLTPAKLGALGVKDGHRDLLMSVLFESGAPHGGAPAEANGLPRVKQSEVGAFPALGVTGRPTSVAWKMWRPRFVGHMRPRVGDAFLLDAKAVLTDPHKALPISHVPHSAENRVLFNEVINGGSGMPERLQAQLPVRLLDEELGLEVLQWIGKHVEAAADSAAEVVTEWLTAPPIVVEAKRYNYAGRGASRVAWTGAEGRSVWLCTNISAEEAVTQEAVREAEGCGGGVEDIEGTGTAQRGECGRHPGDAGQPGRRVQC